MSSQNNSLLWAAAGIGAFLATRAILGKRYNFKDKVVLVTGGSRGLGLVMARQLAEEGAKLAICARDADELEKARLELADFGGEVQAIPCDVTSRTEVNQ